MILLLYNCSRLVIGPNPTFDERSHRVLSDDFPKILDILLVNESLFLSNLHMEFLLLPFSRYLQLTTVTNSTVYLLFFAYK